MKSRSVGCAGPFLVVVLWATPTLADQEQPAPQETTVVEGQVFDHIGAGVKDAEIAVTRPADGSDQPEPLAKTTTNATGDFRLVIEGKISGKLLVSISKKGYSAASREIEIDPEDEFPAFVDVELAGAAILFGVVRDARTDKPIAGASIRVGATFRDWSGESGPEGEFRIPDLPPGEVTVTVDADGYGREKFEVKSVEQLGHLIVTLKPERIVHLQTEDAQGQPVGGVIVECIDENRRDFRSLATDAEGKLTIRGLRYDTRFLALRLTHDQYVSSQDFDREIELPEESVESTHKLILEQAGTLIGTITDQSTRQPLNGARVIVGEATGERMIRDWTGFDGAYRINGVRPGRQVVTVHLRGFGPELADVEVQAGKTATLDLKLGPGAQVGGVVVGPEDAPLAGVHVMAVRWREYETLGLQALTDEEGRFVIADAPGDEFLVTLLHPSHDALQNRPLRAPRTDYRFQMTPRTGGPGASPGLR
ncbi:MAG: carboxypeptidase regulatory-like domain-containing protein, partial [Planctomycetota bacterium]